MVLCSLYDASTTIQVPTYVNSNRLVSGKTPSESNVYDDLVALKSDYPENYLWDMTRSYTSKELGTATGVEAFAYMLSDKVFGAMAASKLKDQMCIRDRVWTNQCTAAPNHLPNRQWESNFESSPPVVHKNHGSLAKFLCFLTLRS